MSVSLPFKIFLITTVAMVAAHYLLTSVTIVGTGPVHYSAADLIQMNCPFHLVPVTWVSGNNESEKIKNWCVAETKARLASLSALWVLAVSFITWRHFGERSHSVPSNGSSATG
jgi:hypothetical protein